MAQAAASAFAALALSFSTLQTSVVHQQKEHRQVRAAADAAAIDRADRDALAFARGSWSARNDFVYLRRRARLYRSPVPGTPPGQNDPWLWSDLRRYAHDVESYARSVAQLQRETAALVAGAVKDPALVDSAQRLEANARELRSQTYWLALDARDGSWDLRGAGFTIEAMDIERASLAAANSASDIETDARELVNRVRP